MAFRQGIYFIRITVLSFILEIYLKNSLLLCFEYAKKTEGASRPRFRPQVAGSAKIATREESDIASTSFHAYLCNSLALQSLKKNDEVGGYAKSIANLQLNLGQNKMEQ